MVTRALALLLCLASASWAAPPMELQGVSVSPANPASGGTVTLRATLLNKVIRKWDNFDYVLAGELLDKKGKTVVMESHSVPLQVHPNPGETGSVSIKGIRMPADLGGTLYFRMIIRDGSEVVARSRKVKVEVGKPLIYTPDPEEKIVVKSTVAVAVSTVPVIPVETGPSTAPFSSVGLSERGQLRLVAARTYLEGDIDFRRERLADVIKSMRASKPAGEPDNIPPLASVQWPSGGELWDAYGLTRLDDWDDDRPVARASSGRWFGFLGAQKVSGGGGDGSYFNARLGSTLYHERYDLAGVLGSSPAGTSYGAVARARFRNEETLGLNVGIEYIAYPTGKPEKVVSGVAGLSWAVPSGSFDLAFTFASDVTTLSFGYTVYVSR